MNIGIITFHSANNYGAVLQCYALAETLKALGSHSVSLIDLPLHGKSTSWRSGLRNKVLTQAFSAFRFDFLPVVVAKEVKQSLYVFGSDQIWNPQITKDYTDLFFGEWVTPSIPKISYAASFGLSSWQFEEHTLSAKKWLSSYHSVGIRESSGVDICKDVFAVDATKVLDPTLLLADYEAVFKKRKPSSSLVCYIFGKNEKNIDELRDIAKKKKLKPVLLNDLRCRKGIKSVPFPTVSTWLSYLESSQMVLTDSFHCMVFSIIFKKNFIAIPAIPERAGRMLSLLSDIGLESRFFNNISEAGQSDVINQSIDYGVVNSKLIKLREESLMFLKNSLSGVKF
jgi:hypothetical protein